MGNKEFAKISTDTPKAYLEMEKYFNENHLDFFESKNGFLTFINNQGETHDQIIRISKDFPKANITSFYNYESNQFSVGYELGYQNGVFRLKNVELSYQIHYPDALIQLDDETQTRIITKVQDFYTRVDEVVVHESGSYHIKDNADKEIGLKMVVDDYHVHALKNGRTIDIVSINRIEQ